MICLAADTTSTRLTLALIKGDERFYKSFEVGKSGHSAMLMPAVDELLKEGGVTADMLDVVAAVVGPGSFTGIRIGVAAMTALALATGAKRVSVTSFDLISYNRARVVAAVDAGRGNVYAARCEDGKTLETAFYSSAFDKALEGAVYAPLGDAAATLADVVAKKAEENMFSAVLEPFYMRKSQAEREADDV